MLTAVSRAGRTAITHVLEDGVSEVGTSIPVHTQLLEKHSLEALERSFLCSFFLREESEEGEEVSPG